jgi:hypothetical protein
MQAGMKNYRKTIICVAFGLAAVPSLSGTFAQTTAPQSPSFLSATTSSYADIADLVTIAPTIIDLQIRKIRPLPESQTVGVPANVQRALIESDVLSFISGKNVVAGQVRFLLDIPKDARGKIPKLKKQRFLAMGRSVAGRSDMIQLVRPDALIEYSPANDQMIRAVASEAIAANAPQAITGIASAYHNAGTILGEGETQIFLNTANGQPFGLSVVSMPGRDKQWTVSTSEVITQADPAPKRNTLLWYRLACGLPKQLSPALVGSGEGDSAHAAKAQADYAFVIKSLGPCGRTRSGG